MIRLRPVTEPDLEFLEKFVREPGLIGPDWAGFRIRSAQFRSGQWRDAILFSRLRSDPPSG